MDGVLSSRLSSRVTLIFMLGSEDGAAGAAPNPLPELGTGSGRDVKPIPASLAGSHGALGGGAAADLERICVKDEGSGGAACGALGALFAGALFNAPNICVSEGCGAFGEGAPESPRSRSSAGSLVNSSVNPPDEDGAAGAVGNGEAAGGATGGVAIEKDAVAVSAGACTGVKAGGAAGAGTTGIALAAPPNVLNDPVAERLYAPVALSGAGENAAGFSFGLSGAAVVLKSAVNPPG